jgi:hypothetical protein
MSLSGSGFNLSSSFVGMVLMEEPDVEATDRQAVGWKGTSTDVASGCGRSAGVL